MAAQSEKRLMAELVDVLDRFGWLTYHTFDSRRSAPGFPDLIAVRDGRMLALECKSATGKLTTDQRAWLSALAGVPGVACYVVRPADDLAELLAIL
jgi:hypothetical protein